VTTRISVSHGQEGIACSYTRLTHSEVERNRTTREIKRSRKGQPMQGKSKPGKLRRERWLDEIRDVNVVRLTKQSNPRSAKDDPTIHDKIETSVEKGVVTQKSHVLEPVRTTKTEPVSGGAGRRCFVFGTSGISVLLDV
jgi:hypothetical protein